MGPELTTAFCLILHALVLTLIISMVLSYATVIAALRPVVAAAAGRHRSAADAPTSPLVDG